MRIAQWIVPVSTLSLIGILSGCVTSGSSDDPEPRESEVPADANSALLRWTVPSTRENGSSLAIGELSGYKVMVTNLSNQESFYIEIDNPLATQTTVNNLNAGEWEFAISSVDTEGVYGAYSSTVSKIIL